MITKANPEVPNMDALAKARGDLTVVLWKVLGHGHSKASLNALISSIEALIDAKIVAATEGNRSDG
jgi:hypothetical protein